MDPEEGESGEPQGKGAEGGEPLGADSGHVGASGGQDTGGAQSSTDTEDLYTDTKDEIIKGSPAPSPADGALAGLRRYGRWRVLTYCLICTGLNLPGTWHMLSIVFLGMALLGIVSG